MAFYEAENSGHCLQKKHEKKFVKLCLHLGYTVQKENIWRIYFDWKFKIVILAY